MNDINCYIKFLKCLYKKIYILKSSNNEEYKNNILECDNFINSIYPNLKKIINKKSYISDSDKDYIISIANLYSFDKWKSKVKFISRDKVLSYN